MGMGEKDGIEKQVGAGVNQNEGPMKKLPGGRGTHL